MGRAPLTPVSPAIFTDPSFVFGSLLLSVFSLSLSLYFSTSFFSSWVLWPLSDVCRSVFWRYPRDVVTLRYAQSRLWAETGTFLGGKPSFSISESEQNFNLDRNFEAKTWFDALDMVEQRRMPVKIPILAACLTWWWLAGSHSYRIKYDRFMLEERAKTIHMNRRKRHIHKLVSSSDDQGVFFCLFRPLASAPFGGKTIQAWVWSIVSYCF